ncbi:hypothetical protein DL769_010054 [Monosporascus sp. CRB-8-3]|nr:hypothetical protein DL769_010054 [Monosporascus sp. CRB-8-3]
MSAAVVGDGAPPPGGRKPPRQDLPADKVTLATPKKSAKKPRKLPSTSTLRASGNKRAPQTPKQAAKDDNNCVYTGSSYNSVPIANGIVMTGEKPAAEKTNYDPIYIGDSTSSDYDDSGSAPENNNL